MKKSDNLVDKALEVARKERGVPKKPVKTKGKKTVPEALDWGPGIPLDKLAYLNDDEMALVQAKRMFKGKRKYKGIPAFPDPGDTAAGDRGQGTSSSGGLGNNTTGGGSTYGGGGGSDSGAGGAGGMGSYGGSTEGSRQGGGDGGSGGISGGGVGGSTEGSRQGGGGGSDSGAGGTSSSASGTGTTSSSDTTKTGSTSPASGSLSQPARTETSSYAGPSAVSAPTPPSGYQSYGGYDPTKTAPSTMASEATLDRIASGSSVIGNTTPQGYSTPKIQDRIAPVSYEQAPTTPVGPVDTTGANSPFADPDVAQYDADRPSLAGPNQGLGYSPTAPGTYAGTTAVSSAQAPAVQGATNLGAAKTITDRVPVADAAKPYGDRLITVNETTYSVSPQQMAGLTPAEQQAIAAANQAVEYNPAGVSQQLQSSYNPLSSISPPAQTGALVSSGPPSATRGLPAPTTPSATTNVFYSSPAEQAADVRRAVALAQGAAPPPANVPTGVVPAGTATTPVGEYDYDPAQDPQNYMQPVYPGEEGGPYYMTDEQRAAYLDSVSGTRSSERPPSYYYEPEKEKPVEEEVVKKKKKPEPKPDEKYVRRNYMFENYGKGNARTDADIAAFNRYNQENFNNGGRINDSVQAALRIAKSKLL